MIKMAAPRASNDSHVRIKVYFENNEFDASWLLIDTRELHTMKDVQRYISLKFLGKTVPLYLTLQSCALPDWEKSAILRDNDCVNAKCIHPDSFENQTILVSNSPEDDKYQKKKKKKYKSDSESKQPSTSTSTGSLHSQNSKEEPKSTKEKEVSDSLRRNSGIDDIQNELTCKGDGIGTEIREKKKKKKHKHDKNDSEEEQKEKQKERKRKHNKTENDEDETMLSEPDSKKMSVDSSNSQQFCKGDEKQANFTEGINKETSDLKESNVSIDNRLDSVDSCGTNITNETMDSQKKRKRKRVRKRKKKDEAEVLETPKVNIVKSDWHWGTGQNMYNSQSNKSGTSNEKHKVFGSDSNESSDSTDDVKTKCFKESVVNGNSFQTTQGGNVNQSVHSVSNYYSPKVKQSDTEQSFYSNQDNNLEQSKTVNNLLNEKRETTKSIEQPSILSTSYLKNGVAVYSRSRGKQQQNLKQYAELSKDDQLNTRLTNVSIILQNKTPDETRKTEDKVDKTAVYEAVPIDKSYSQYAPLVGPPRAGDRLAYKMIELSETYTPEVSDYKEAVVLSYNHLSKIIELENQLDKSSKKLRQDGRFEMEFSDDEEMNTSKQNTDTKICLPIDSLLEPKLMC